METLRLPAEMENLERLRGFALDQAERLGFPRELLFKVDLIVEELIVNVIHYAYPDEPGDVEIGCVLEDASTLRIEIRDQGVYFDPCSRKEPDPDQNFTERDIGGLGIYLVRRMANGLLYRREEDQNVLSVFFKL
jgi:serine/threonine-protein kinase RsbW